jgi:hypothetical protein
MTDPLHDDLHDNPTQTGDETGAGRPAEELTSSLLVYGDEPETEPETEPGQTMPKRRVVAWAAGSSRQGALSRAGSWCGTQPTTQPRAAIRPRRRLLRPRSHRRRAADGCALTGGFAAARRHLPHRQRLRQNDGQQPTCAVQRQRSAAPELVAVVWAGIRAGQPLQPRHCAGLVDAEHGQRPPQAKEYRDA